MGEAMELMDKKTGRLSPFERDAQPAPFVLQQRDEEIIEAVYNFIALAGEQIQGLVGFGCAPRRNIRLRLLFDHGYLDRKFLPTLQGMAKPIYIPGPKSVEVLSRRLTVDAQTIKRHILRAKEMKELFLRHRLSVSDV